ncbi:MAG: hypothetical protein ACP5QT_06495 [Brevinematia bacterium]
MKELRCDFVIDFIDEFYVKKELPLEIKEHIEKCDSCKKYLKMTEFLKENIKVIERVDIRDELFNRISSKRMRFERLFLVGGFVTAILIGMLLFFNPLKKGNLVEGSYANSTSSVMESTDSLEYFYTIALEM